MEEEEEGGELTQEGEEGGDEVEPGTGSQGRSMSRRYGKKKRKRKEKRSGEGKGRGREKRTKEGVEVVEPGKSDE